MSTLVNELAAIQEAIARLKQLTDVRAKRRSYRIKRHLGLLMASGSTVPVLNTLIPDTMAFGRRLAALRATTGLSCPDFARALDCSVVSVRLWERGQHRPQMGNLDVIAKFFSMSIDRLVQVD